VERIVKSIKVGVPVQTAYNQWTRFEEFPQFMNGVEEVRQLDNKRLYWVVNIGDKYIEWYAKITEQIPDQRIAWHSEAGAVNSGVVTFRPVTESMTLVTVQLDYVPEGITEKIGDMLGLLSHRVEDNLERFKNFIESRSEGNSTSSGNQ
jgi:uncharacterized membrane protein